MGYLIWNILISFRQIRETLQSVENLKLFIPFSYFATPYSLLLCSKLSNISFSFQLKLLKDLYE